MTAHDPHRIEGSVLLNNAQVLAMGQMSITYETAERLVDQWLDLRYDPASPWAPLMDAMVDYEAQLTGTA
ncbi:RpiB/LacA/LacB family sugar-phosphate isomerase [Streptomyces sp. H27-D2]|uniref:RpiB/LacA/LacB family sugar-phosphate isomerase n=1 Tax=Streptomyces sp. H27-D2 TaxID=3046304 RepID=UPI002DB92E20|nr:RpiB/LacA/LacB family sugar-phosphate isomerase [Streptomyces sp. H27-D2]MEC4015429.1 RpiB/LacA/LacB family sugar-phosphate isomerase [Streptomyces sp. H27-D2]